MVTKEQAKAAVTVLLEACEYIRARGEVPNGELYAIVMAAGITLDEHNAMVRTLVRTGLVSLTGNVLRWVGPEIPEVKHGS